ncbi:hypothetical protein ACP275_02G118200 [Erythranthe tilingii]
MRPRTRSQWDDHYSNLNNNKKKSSISTTASTGGVRRRSNRLRNSVDSEHINNTDQDCFIICDKSTASFDRDLRRKNKVNNVSDINNKCRNAVDSEEPISNMDQDFIIIGEKNSSEDNYVSNSDKRSSGTRTRNSVSSDRDFRGENIVNVSDSDDILHSEDDDDDGVEYLGEKIFGNGSTSKFSTEKSRSESDSKAGNQDDEIYYFITKRENGGNNSLDRSKDVDVGNNSSSDGSDKSLGDLSLSEEESTSDDEESLDDDYNVDESTDSEPSDDSHYGVDENENRTEGEEENSSSTIDSKKEKDDESDEGYNRGSRCSRRISKEGREKDVIFIDVEEKSPTVGKCIKKSIGQSKENDDVIVEGCRAITRSSRSKTNANNRKNEAAVISNESEDERFSPCIGNGGGSPTEKSNKLKKRKVSIFEDSDKGNENGDTSTSSVKHLPSYSCAVGENDDVIVEGCHAITRSSSRSNKASANNPENEDPVTSIDNIEEEMLCPGIDESNKSGLKKTRASIFEDSDKANDKVSKSPNNEVFGKKKNRAERNIELIKILVESMNLFKGQKCPIEESGFAARERLPTRFRFEDEVEPTVEKSEWEKEMDSLFHDLELGLRGLDADHDSSKMENDDVEDIDTSPAACCRRGEHQPILDEQIGIVCKYCAALILHIKYVLPPFYTPPPRKRDRKDIDIDSPNSVTNQIHFQDSAYHGAAPPDSNSSPASKGGGTTTTVWDLIPGVENEMYPHQREGFEFIWRNIAGGIAVDKLQQQPPLTNSGGKGCIISHAPGTGKTRLTIVFLASFLKLYPNCRPVIVAPKGMLLAWESEFVKWKVNIPFHNMNKEDMSENEKEFAFEIIARLSGGGGGGFSREQVRWLKLCQWMQGGSILGISYQLFEKIAGENREGDENENENKKMREILLQYTDLLVLDEGHTPRNKESRIWKALTKVSAKRCIILSGTPFQNNLTELYNTLCLVNPNISPSWCGNSKKTSVDRKKWKAMLDPFVHIHKGTILEESLPGLMNTFVFLHPTELQKNLLEASAKERKIFARIRLVSMVSVHPSLFPEKRRSVAQKNILEDIESDFEAGVKTKFVVKLIHLAEALNERVLIFSQYIDPLVFIKNTIKSRFSWNEGREILYMDGQLDERQRQDSISSFNDERSGAKVLLASERACSEGINLVGASRVVLLDTVWNPSVEKQAISRAYRIGQKKVVYVYRLFTSGTEVRQYSQQAYKERISQLIFADVDDDGEIYRSDKSKMVREDKVLDAMAGIEGFGDIFEKIIHQPKESDLIQMFGLVDCN